MTSPTNIIDFSRYMPPGVYMNPRPGPQLAVNSSQPTAVGIIGQAVGYETFVQTVQIPTDTNNTTPAPTQTLAQQGINTSTLKVTNPSTGGIYALTTDYTVVLISGTSGTANALYAIERVIDGGHISPGDYVQISYQYTDPSYYTPYVFYTYNDVVTAYGPPFNTTTGAIQSGLTLAPK